MASSQVEVKRSDAQLKHLSFVKILAINAVAVVANLYDSVKRSSGALKSTVGKVENAVAVVVSPFYERFKGVPSDVLVLLDKKVDEVTYKIGDLTPPAAKKAVFNAQSIFKTLSHIAESLIKEAKAAGPFAAISHAGTISKDFAITHLVMAWHKANQYPALQRVSEMTVTTVLHWSEKYDHLVKEMSAKGYSLFSYFPLVPFEEMAKAYKQAEAAAGKNAEVAAGKKAAMGSSSDSESDKE
ncbi:hypothetical protein BUALT_Bualt05G0169900 [Buddleja alternifolia]|uniref:REF/SRPP-like protein n=1 Tax=Buddleja alternifolia TaxID=168488 RepID=A0AAV6XRU2_9LAMI|nr:hypothetical protein BUALT_Bualt05G0169900 [Buddleja alternifolia]